jgi:hypothetical protein
LTIVLLLTSLSSLCQGQAIKLVKQLDAHSYVVEIGGVQFKAVDNVLLNEQKNSFDKLDATAASLKLQLQAADRQIEDKVKDVQVLEQKITIKEQERDSARGDLQEAKGLIAQQRLMLDNEIAFRKDAVQMIPKGNSSGFWGKVLDALNSQQGQVAFKLGIQGAVPVFNAFRCSK